jgi:hypothetical protein
MWAAVTGVSAAIGGRIRDDVGRGHRRQRGDRRPHREDLGRRLCSSPLLLASAPRLCS